jgi:hypothetical protein
MKRQITTIVALVILGLIEIFLFLTATSYIQLGIATLFYPVLVIAIFRLFPGKATKIAPAETPVQIRQTPIENPIKEVEEKVSDVNKRAFLNLVFSAGIAFFIYSIFNKRAELSFLGKAEGTGTVALQDTTGKKIDPAQDQPTDGYQISDIDDINTDFIYYGYTKLDGSWYIAKHDVENGAFRYIRGRSNFPDNWNNRSRLSYNYFHAAFA